MAQGNLSACLPVTALTTGHDGICLIDNFEQCRLRAYKDAVSVLTIGWGHTNSAGSFRFKAGAVITQAKADAILLEDIKVFEAGIRSHVAVELAQYEFDGLTSLVLNIGVPHFASSTLLARLNRGDRRGAAAQFMAWTHGGGRVLPGLVTRRQCEAALFSGDVSRAIAMAVAHGHIPDHPEAAEAAVKPDAPVLKEAA